jgi:pimeloyl-ACP methyl ester carboxylesterase
MRVFLIHGMGRTQVSMALLGRRLKAAGHEVLAFNYFVAKDALDVIRARFVEHVEEHRKGEPFAVIGHSLGNIITRLALPALTTTDRPGLERFIMLAPPNQPPVLARALEKNRVFRALTRDAGTKLLDQAFYADLPLPEIPTLVVAGNKGPKARWLPFKGEPSDGVVRVEETRLPGIPHVEVPAIHTFIMNDAEVARIALRFLERGTLLEESGATARDVETPSLPR